MNYTVLDTILILVIAFISSIIFELLYTKFDIKEKFFAIFARNRMLYHLMFWSFFLLLVILLIILPKYNKYLFIVITIYFTGFSALYQTGSRWLSYKSANNIYIKNIDKLRRAKQKYQKRKKKSF